jgi:hypothetical protein
VHRVESEVGFIVHPKGYILTNHHVIQDATKIRVGLQTGETYTAEVVGVDNETDVAVIKIAAPRDLPDRYLGDSNAAQVGDWVLAMGSPFGLDQTVTAGIISKKERESPYFSTFQRFLQTDACHQSRQQRWTTRQHARRSDRHEFADRDFGPVITTASASPCRQNETNFVYKQIIAQGKVKRGYLGITLESVHDEFAKVYGMSEAKGAIVAFVAYSGIWRDVPPCGCGIQAKRHHRRIRRTAGAQRTGSDSSALRARPWASR